MPIDPVTGTAIGVAGGTLTLVNAIVAVCRESAKDPKAHPPALADVIAALPGAAQKLTGEFITEVQQLRQDCLKAGIDLDKNLDQLREDSRFYQRRRRKVLKTFQARVDRIAGEMSLLFDDVVSVADCCDRLDAVARSFEASRQQKDKLREETKDELPLGAILDNLEKHAERVRAELGDLNRQK